MSVDNVKASIKYRRPLNDEQVKVLGYLYAYRFGTASLLASRLGRTNIKLVQKKLKIVEDQSLIAKHYSKTYKLQGRPAEYYLLPKGARMLKAKHPDDGTITEQGIKSLYRNKTTSSDFMLHCLNVFRASNRLHDLHPGNLMLFTQSHLHAYGYFPAWKPGLFLSLKGKTKDKAPGRFFLDIFDGTKPFFVSVRKIRNYITYSEEGNWPTDDADFPVVLAICESQRTEIKLRRQIRKALDESYEEITFATTTMEQFFDPDNKRGKVWRTVEENEEMLTLRGVLNESKSGY